MQTVNGLHNGVDRCVEAEWEVCAVEVVVNRLRHADEREAVLAPHVARGAKRPLAADDDERVERALQKVGLYTFGVVGGVVRACARRAEYGAAARKNPRDREARERLHVVFDEAAPAVRHAEDLCLLFERGAADDRAYDCVEAGAVAAARQYANTKRHRDTYEDSREKLSIDLV